MTAVLAAALAASLLANVALIAARRRGGPAKAVNVVGGSVLPLPDDPDWREVAREFLIDYERENGGNWYKDGPKDVARHISGLELGGVRVEDLRWQTALTRAQIRPAVRIPILTVDGHTVTTDRAAEADYARAVWTAWFTRRSIEGAVGTPLLGP